MNNKWRIFFLAIAILCVDIFLLCWLISSGVVTYSNIAFVVLILSFVSLPLWIGFTVYSVLKLFSFTMQPTYSIYPGAPLTALRGHFLMFILHLALGMMLREWIGAGFPIKLDFLFLYLLIPPLLIFDSLLIYAFIKKTIDLPMILIPGIIRVIAVIVGIYIGWPMK